MSRKLQSSRPGFLGTVVAIAACLTVFAGPAPAVEPGYEAWFKPSEETKQVWEFLEVTADSRQVVVRSKSTNSGKPTRRIMVLFAKPSSAYDIAVSKMLNVFYERGIQAEFRLFNFERDPTRGQVALDLAKKNDYELIFSMGSASTAWLWDNFKGGEVPVVSVCSKDPVVLGQTPSYDRGTGTNFAFTSLNMPVEVQMAYVLELKPNLKNLGVLVNSKNVSAMETQAKPIKRYAEQRGIRVLELAVNSPENAEKELQSLLKRAVAKMRKNDPTLSDSLFWITGSTTIFREIRTINANADRVPVLSVVPDVVMAGEDSAVLSIGISFESNAHLAAIYGADVLQRRANVGDLEVGIVSPPDIAINFLKAREIGLEIPFSFLESASDVYDYNGQLVRNNGKPVTSDN